MSQSSLRYLLSVLFILSFAFFGLFWVMGKEELISEASEIFGNPNNFNYETKKIIFYNAYIPQKNQPRAKEILAEHIGLIKGSPWWTEISAINYITIGVDTLLENCSKCIRLAHYPSGDETLTLQRLYEHCLQFPQDEVVYLHSKGTFHDKPANTLFRHFLTKGALSEACFKDKPANCTVCSSRFSPFPHYHTPGNMWNAKCSYIKQLIPPRDFAHKMSELLTFVNGTNRSSLLRHIPPYLAKDRYSSEHWVHHHPYAIPCDVCDDSRYNWGYWNLPDGNWTPQVQPAPRWPMATYFGVIKGCQGNEDLCDWQRTPGRLIAYGFLYNMTPPEGSWIWNYFLN